MSLKFDNDVFLIINEKIKIPKPKTSKRKNHLSKPDKLSCFSFDLPLSVCKSQCDYYKNKICYVQNNKLHESYPNRKKILKRNLKLAKSDQFVKVLTGQIRNKKQRLFRFFSSGDFIDLDHMKKVVQICRNLPDIKFWITTKNDYVLTQYFQENNLTVPKNCIIKLSSPVALMDMPKFTKDFCKKYNISYSLTTLNNDLVTCKSSLGFNESKCGNCELCFDNNFIPVYKIHNNTSVKNAKILIQKRVGDLKND
jgi:hypothetical protein